MEAYAPLVNGGLLAVFTLVWVWLARGRFDAIDRRFDQVDRRLDQMDARMDRFEAGLSELRTLVTQLTIAVGAQPRPQTG